MALHPATKYAIDAIEQKITVGHWERLACLRHLYDLGRSGQLSNNLRARIKKATDREPPRRDSSWAWKFDGAQATRVAVDWFGYLVHVEGPLAGKPIKLIPAHIFDVSMIFGWISKSETIPRSDGSRIGVRRFTKSFDIEARKNAKTIRGSGIGLYMLVGDAEEEPAIYCTALDHRQARVLYNYSRKMAEKSRNISRRLKIGKFEMSHRARGGEMTAFSGEVKNKDSFNPSCAFVDEYHSHPTSELLDVMTSAQGQRAQPLIFTITTAGYNVGGPCHQEYEYGKLILEGSTSSEPDKTRNDHYFVMIREMDESDDEHDPRNWIKCNPLRASTKKGLEILQQQHDEAFGSGMARKIRAFRVKNLNRWVQGNENSYLSAYMVADGARASKWDRAAVPRERFLELTRDLLCLVGIDLSKKIDLTAIAYMFVIPDGRIGLSAHGFMPEAAIDQHEKTDRIPYRDWARDGWLTITPGDVTDYAYIREQIETLEGGWRRAEAAPVDQLFAPARAKKIHYAAANGWKIHELMFDPYNATHFMSELENLGYTTIEVRQTMPNLNEPTKYFRELIASEQFIHDGSPLLKFCAQNAQEIIDSKENIMISKKNASDTKRVDLLTAAINASFRIKPFIDYMRVVDDIGV